MWILGSLCVLPPAACSAFLLHPLLACPAWLRHHMVKPSLQNPRGTTFTSHRLTPSQLRKCFCVLRDGKQGGKASPKRVDTTFVLTKKTFSFSSIVRSQKRKQEPVTSVSQVLFKTENPGAPPVAQWMGVCPPGQGTQV